MIPSLPRLQDQSQFGACLEQCDIAEIVGQFGILQRIFQYQILHDEFDVDHAACIVLQIELGRTVRMCVMDALAHFEDFRFQPG